MAEVELEDWQLFITEPPKKRFEIPPRHIIANGLNRHIANKLREAQEMIEMSIQVNPVNEAKPAVLINDTAADMYTVQMIAHACHERNRQFCILYNEPNIAPVWEDYADEFKQTTINGVMFTLSNIRQNELKARPDDAYTLIQNMAKANHDNWSQDKSNDGWVYGEAKDFALKTHPCLVDYDALPEQQRMKDRIFIAEVLHHWMALQSDVNTARNSRLARL